MIDCLAAKAGGRIITTDLARSEMDAEQSPALAPSNAECCPRLREDETLTDYLCRVAPAIYERERANLGSPSAAAHRLGMRRNTPYDWLERARRQVAKLTTAPNH